MSAQSHLLTVDTVPAHQLADYVRQDWTALPGVLCGWSVVFGPVTQVLFLQQGHAGEVPLHNAGEHIRPQRRERRVLRPEKAFVPTSGEERLFELRSYDVHTGQGALFRERMMGNLPLRERYSPNFGVWSSQSGRLETVLHLWGYRNLEEREEVRSRLKDDTEWGKYTASVLPMLEKLQSTLLMPLPCFT